MRSEIAAELYVDEVIDGQGWPIAIAPAPGDRYLDKVSRVTALTETEIPHVWDDRILENQHRRFLNGS